MGGSLHLCVGHSVDIYSAHSADIYSVDIYSVDILTGSGIIVTEPRKLRHCPHCLLLPRLPASQPPNLLTPSHFVTGSLQLYFVQNLSDIFFESFIGFEVKKPKPFFSPLRHEIQTFTGDTRMIQVTSLYQCNWFIGLLVYLHDLTGYTTNNYLVSCRISS